MKPIEDIRQDIKLAVDGDPALAGRIDQLMDELEAAAERRDDKRPDDGGGALAPPSSSPLTIDLFVDRAGKLHVSSKPPNVTQLDTADVLAAVNDPAHQREGVVGWLLRDLGNALGRNYGNPRQPAVIVVRPPLAPAAGIDIGDQHDDNRGQL